MSTATTNIKTKKRPTERSRSKLVPVFRFKEFEGDWNNKKIRDVLTIGSGKDYKHLKPGNIPVYGTGGLMAKVDTPIHTGETVFIGRKGSIDKPFYYNGGFWTVDTLFYTHSFQASVPYFVYGLFQKINWYKHNEASGVPSLSKTTIGSLVVSLPALPEQQKIASFLSAVDEKIQQLTKQKALLEQYKKGVMQQLFSGQLRFKPARSAGGDENGNSYPDWEEKRLGEICIVNPKSKNLPSSFIYIDLESVKDGQLIKESRIDLVDSPSRAQRGLAVDDILYQTVRPYQKNNLFFNRIGDYVASTGYAQLRAKESSMYVFQLLHFDGFVNKVLVRCTGTSYPAINSNDLAKINVSVPVIEEQKKIATYLSRIDTKIEAVNNQITQTQTFKKGLLQQMFV